MFGRRSEHPKLIDHITEKCYVGVYDKDIFTKYSQEEIEKVGHWVDHDRDFLFTYVGLRQVDKYLVQDRSSNRVYETPQFMYMMSRFDNLPRISKGDKGSHMSRDTTI